MRLCGSLEVSLHRPVPSQITTLTTRSPQGLWITQPGFATQLLTKRATLVSRWRFLLGARGHGTGLCEVTMTVEIEQVHDAWRAAEAAYVNAVAEHQREATDAAWDRVMQARQLRCAAEAAYEHVAMAHSIHGGSAAS